MVLSTIRKLGRSIFYLLSDTRYAKKCCFLVEMERGRERCVLSLSVFLPRRNFPGRDRNDQTSLMIRIEKYGYIVRVPCANCDTRKGRYRRKTIWKWQFVKYTIEGFYATLTNTITVLWITLRIKADVQSLGENQAKRERIRKAWKRGLSPRDVM